MSTAPTTEMQLFCDRVLEEIRLQGITIAELARRCGLKRPALSAMLHGRTGNCNISTAAEIAKGLNKPLYKLLKP